MRSLAEHQGAIAMPSKPTPMTPEDMDGQRRRILGSKKKEDL